MTNNRSLITILLSVVIAGIGFSAAHSEQITPSVFKDLNKVGVTVGTDKAEYDKSDMIQIFVRNQSETPVLYLSGGDRFWAIEYFKDDQWVNPAYEEGGSFQLTEKDIGESCFVTLYERALPVELKSGATLSAQWNQRICPFGTTGPGEPRTVKRIEKGQYRIVFDYGSHGTSEDPYKLVDRVPVYSNSFSIK